MINKIFLFLLGISFLIIPGCINDKDDPVWSLSTGDILPQFSVKMNDGKSVSTEILRGKVSMIVFFNTGCGDCREELPRIQEVYDRSLEENLPVEFICISRGEGDESVAKYWKENSLTLPYSAQNDKAIYQLFASSIIPRIYISDTGLKITSVFTDSPLPTVELLLATLNNEIDKIQ